MQRTASQRASPVVSRPLIANVSFLRRVVAAPESLKETALDFLKLVAAGSVREAYRRYVGPGFRHHNPYFRGDAASLMAAMEQNATKNPKKTLEVVSALQDGDRVAVFSRVRQNPSDLGGAV